MKEFRTTFIYGLKDPRDGLYHYIGKSNRPAYRKYQHLKDKGTNGYKDAWIADLKSNGLKPELEIIEEVLMDEWQEREIYWIAYYKEKEHPLTNIAAGGLGYEGTMLLPSYDFMKNYIREDLWHKFELLSITEKDEICIEAAQAMVRFYEPFLRNKMKTGQRYEPKIIKQIEFNIGRNTATRIVEGMCQA